MKPVALVERAIRNSSKPRDTVLDCFGGSGTTMIAAERTGRRAVLLEIDPAYADVIVRRWQEATGEAAVLDGEDHGHLQQHAEKIADVVGAVLGKALGAIAALQEKSLAVCDSGECLLQVARLTCKNQRRERRKLRLDIGQCLRIGIFRHLHDWLLAPAIGRPPLGHD